MEEDQNPVSNMRPAPIPQDDDATGVVHDVGPPSPKNATLSTSQPPPPRETPEPQPQPGLEARDEDGDIHIPTAAPAVTTTAREEDPAPTDSVELDDEMSERKNQDSRHSHAIPQASFPTHNSPRTWFLTSSLSPLIIRLVRLLLAHGDYVVACLPPHEIEDSNRNAEFKELVRECKSSRKDREGWKDRIRSIRCDGRVMGQAGAAVAEAVNVFGRIDILLCCKSEAVVGTVEELSTTPATQNLVRDQFETIFFSQVNFIKAALPLFRQQHTGHIMILTSIGGHIGTPGMPMYTAATWALEGFCDSLAYEIAPFNIKVTIVQPNKEIQSLTNKIVFAPQLPWYDAEINHPAPSIRDMLSNVLNLNPETAMDTGFGGGSASSGGMMMEMGGGDMGVGLGGSGGGGGDDIVHRYPKLPPSSVDRLVMETVHALTAIGGHENPPARHIVGFEGSIAVKEKLKTVTEELEDFVDATLTVDIFDSELKTEAAARERQQEQQQQPQGQPPEGSSSIPAEGGLGMGMGMGS